MKRFNWMKYSHKFRSNAKRTVLWFSKLFQVKTYLTIILPYCKQCTNLTPKGLFECKFLCTRLCCIIYAENGPKRGNHINLFFESSNFEF